MSACGSPLSSNRRIEPAVAVKASVRPGRARVCLVVESGGSRCCSAVEASWRAGAAVPALLAGGAPARGAGDGCWLSARAAHPRRGRRLTTASADQGRRAPRCACAAARNSASPSILHSCDRAAICCPRFQLKVRTIRVHDGAARGQDITIRARSLGRSVTASRPRSRSVVLANDCRDDRRFRLPTCQLLIDHEISSASGGRSPIRPDCDAFKHETSDCCLSSYCWRWPRPPGRTAGRCGRRRSGQGHRRRVHGLCRARKPSSRSVPTARSSSAT